MENDIEKKAFSFIISKKSDKIEDKYYCETRDVFQARLDRMTNDLLKPGALKEDDVYIITAIAGEIGNNSFDHNIGLWVGIKGVFFGYFFKNEELKIVLADAGQGVYNTLKKVKPEIRNNREALRVAFNERISGRAPESRGNGLKFVKINIKDRGMNLRFISGNAKIELNELEKISEIDENYQGCIAIINYKI